MSELENNLRTEAPEATNTEQTSLIQLLGSAPDESGSSLRSEGDRGDDAPLVDGREASAHAPTESMATQDGYVDSQQVREPTQVEPAQAAALEAQAMNARRARSNATVKATMPLADRPTWSILQAAGATFALLGMSLFAAPKISAAAADWFAHHSELRGQSGTLIVVGLCLLLTGFLRSTLRDLRGSLEVVRSETARLAEISKDGQSIRATLNTVRSENSTLSQDVVRLEAELTRLVEIVENPDYTMSIFRLAASVDQLGKHVEVSMKGQFEQLEPRIAAVVQHVDQAERQLTSTIAQMSSLMKEQYRSSQLALKEGLDELHSAAEIADTRSEQNQETMARIEALIQSRHEAVSEGLSSLGERVTKSEGQIVSGVSEQRGRLEQQIEKQSAAWLAQFKQLEGKLEQAERNQTASVKQIGQQVDLQLGVQAKDLRQGLKLLADQTGQQHEEFGGKWASFAARIEAGFEQLGSRVDQQARELQLSIQQVREQASEATHASRRELDAGFEQFALRVGQQAGEQQAAIQRTLEATRSARSELAANLEQLATQLDKSERDQLANSLDVAQKAEQANVATRRELASKLEQLESQLEQLGREQLAAVRKASQDATQIATTATREFETGMQQLCVQQEQQALEHQASVQQASVDAQQTTTASRRELAAIFEQVGARIEKAVALRSDELAGDLLDVSAILIFITNEVRTCIAEAIGGLAVPNSVAALEAKSEKNEGDSAAVAQLQPDDVWAEDVWMSPSDAPVKPAQQVDPDWSGDATYPSDEDRS